MQIIALRLYFFLIVLFLPSCAFLYKKNYSSCALQEKSLSLEFVNNVYIFDSLSSLVYEELYACFARKGYTLRSKDAPWRLQVAIIELTPVCKYVSSEILLFHMDVLLVLECILIDSNGTIKDKKQFKRTELVSRSYNTAFKESFERFVYKKMLKKMAPEIERYFRKCWSNYS